MTTRRQISAFVLLAVFLPIVVLSSLHTHEPLDIAETECVHDHCGGHLTQLTTPLHPCVLCQFLTLPMLTAVAVGMVFLLNRGVRLYASCHCRFTSVVCGVISLRGPPACLNPNRSLDRRCYIERSY